jgi:hemerythrin-like domain-containing protein
MLKSDIADSYIELYKKHAETGSAQLLSFVRDKLKQESNKTQIDGIECYIEARRDKFA